MSHRVLAITALLGAAACVSAGAGTGTGTTATPVPATSPTTPSPAPAAGPPPVTATPAPRRPDPVRIGPSVLRYLIHRRIDITQSLQGQESSSRLGFGIFATSTIRGPADTAGYRTTITVDSIVADSGVALPGTINLATARGLIFSGVLLPSGELRNPTASDTTTAQALAQILGTFRDFYPRFPATGLTLGAQWTDTLSRPERAGAFDRVTVTVITGSLASAIVERDGAHSVQIQSDATITLAGTGNQGGQPMTLQGAGTRHSVEFVAVDGRYLGGESLDSTNLSIGLPLQGLTVPVRQVSYSLIRVLR